MVLSISSFSQDKDEDPNGPQETCAPEANCGGSSGEMGGYCDKIWNYTRTETTSSSSGFSFSSLFGGSVSETTTVSESCSTGGIYRCIIGC